MVKLLGQSEQGGGMTLVPCQPAIATPSLDRLANNGTGGILGRSRIDKDHPVYLGDRRSQFRGKLMTMPGFDLGELPTVYRLSGPIADAIIPPQGVAITNHQGLHTLTMFGPLTRLLWTLFYRDDETIYPTFSSH